MNEAKEGGEGTVREGREEVLLYFYGNPIPSSPSQAVPIHL